MKSARWDGEVFALTFVALGCDLTYFVMPLIIGALVTQHGMSNTDAGFVATGQMLACAIFSFILAPRVRHLRPRATMALGLILVALGNLGCLVGHSTALLVTGRLAAGVGEALANVMVGVLIAHRNDPDRGFAWINIGITVGAMLVFLVAPLLSPLVGQNSIFWILGALPLLVFPCLLYAPAAVAPPLVGVAATPSGPFIVTPPAIAALLAIVGFGVSGNAIFTFCEQIGEGVGVSYTMLVHMMFWVSAATAAGPVVAGWIGGRFGRTVILAIAFLGVAVAGPLTGAARNPLMFFIGLNAGGFFLLLGTPFYNGLLAAMDPEGRLVALSRGVVTIGAAITPSIASLMLMSGAGFPALGYLSAVGAVASFALIYTAARETDRRSQVRLAHPKVRFARLGFVGSRISSRTRQRKS